MYSTELNAEAGVSYVFGPFRLTPSQRLLTHNHVPVKLGGKAFNILHLLVIHAGSEVSKQALISTIWPDTYVDEASLKVHISSLRRALGDNLRAPEYIATIAGHGYQFIERVLLDRSEPMQPSHGTLSERPCFVIPSSAPLIGRESDLERVSRVLEHQSLVTIVGPGGVGKTSVAIAVAHRLCDRFTDGAHFVDLSAADSSALVPQVIARSVGLRGDPPDLIAFLSRYLNDKRVLLVLDNCEHVLAYAADMSARLIGSGIAGALLATSREPLGNRLETVVRLEPLASASERSGITTVRAALTYPALELFMLRAREVLGRAPGDAEVPAIVQLCKLLDGLPLAIEIAAARLERFSPDELLASMKKHLPLADGSARDRHPRQRTLRATLDWSYELLTGQEAAIFCALSTFATDFGPTEVSAMGRLMGFDPYETAGALNSLLSKSLLVADVDEDQPTYRLLTTTRSYASTRLEKESYAGEVHKQHAAVVLSSLERADAEWGWTDHDIWRSNYGARVADIRKALDWCFSGKGDVSLGISLTAAAIRIWNEQSLIGEQSFQVARALRRSSVVQTESAKTAALATAQAWSLTLSRSFLKETDDAWSEALRFAEHSGDVQQSLSAYFGQAVFLVYAGRHGEVPVAMAAARRLALAVDESALFDADRLEALALVHLGHVAAVQPRLEELSIKARQHTRSKAIRYHLQRYVGVQTTLALSTWLLGRQADALAVAEEAVRTTGEHEQLMGQAHTLALAALPIALLSGRKNDLRRYSSLLQSALSQETLAHWLPLSAVFSAFAEQDEPRAERLQEAEQALSQLRHDGFLLRLPMYLGFVAEGWLNLKNQRRASVLLAEAMEVLESTGERWYLPELLRLRAALLTSQGSRREARQLLDEGLRYAQEAGLASFEARLINDSHALSQLCGEKDKATAHHLNPPRPRMIEQPKSKHDGSRQPEAVSSRE